MQDIEDLGLVTQAQLHPCEKATCKDVKKGLRSPHTQIVPRDTEKLLRYPIEILDMIARFLEDCTILVIISQTKCKTDRLQKSMGAPVVSMPVSLSIQVYSLGILFRSMTYLIPGSSLSMVVCSRLFSTARRSWKWQSKAPSIW